MFIYLSSCHQCMRCIPLACGFAPHWINNLEAPLTLVQMNGTSTGSFSVISETSQGQTRSQVSLKDPALNQLLCPAAGVKSQCCMRKIDGCWQVTNNRASEGWPEIWSPPTLWRAEAMICFIQKLKVKRRMEFPWDVFISTQQIVDFIDQEILFNQHSPDQWSFYNI